MIAILTGVRCKLSVVLICISLMARDSEHFIMCFFFCHLDFFLEKFLFSLAAHSFIGSLILGEYFLPLCGWSLEFRDHFFYCAGAF
jgi:hypothetical protein